MYKGSDYFRRSSVVGAPVLDEELGGQSRVYLVGGAEADNYYWRLGKEMVKNSNNILRLGHKLAVCIP